VLDRGAHAFIGVFDRRQVLRRGAACSQAHRGRLDDIPQFS
jgi:hypothetical protein